SAYADFSAGQELQHTRSTQGEPIVFPPVSEELLGLHRAFGLALVLRLAQSLPLVPFALALGQSDLDLDPRSVEVEFERHQRPAGLLDLLRELEDLLPVEQQLPPTPGRMIRPRSLQVFGDVDVLQPRLVLEDESEAVS